MTRPGPGPWKWVAGERLPWDAPRACTPDERLGVADHVRSEFLWRCLLALSSTVRFGFSGNQAPQLMVPLSLLINTWPWARLPSLLCHEGPVIYDSGMSHKPWQGARGSGPSVFFHSVASEGGRL